MSIQPNRAATPEEVPADTTGTLTLTHYVKLVTEFSSSMDTLAASLPPLENVHPATRQFIRTHQNVSNAYLLSAIVAVEQMPEFRAVSKFDTLKARDTLQFLEAFRPLVDKVRAFADTLENTLRSRRANLVADAFQIYDIAKGVARDPGSTGVTSHVKNMKRDLGQRGRARSKKKPAPAPSPEAPTK